MACLSPLFKSTDADNTVRGVHNYQWRCSFPPGLLPFYSIYTSIRWEIRKGEENGNNFVSSYLVTKMMKVKCLILASPIGSEEL
uniref:Uncharacterized protein n=1 Tax=Salix viminalis TaxID=40686 RepID=A0A6N2KHI7_SALVM